MRLQKRPVLDVHDKSWGWEGWIENCSEYCGKMLYFTRAHRGTSMHFHSEKLETMFCMKGRLQVDYVDTSDGSEHSFDLISGESVQIPRNVPHRLTAREDETVIFEFSTSHRDEDSYRVGPRFGVSGG